VVGVAVAVAVVVGVGVAVAVAVVVVVGVAVAVVVVVAVAVVVVVVVMTVRDIILSHLREVGADGLCCGMCHCDESDLLMCVAGDMQMWDGTPQRCVPAKKQIAKQIGGYYKIGDEIFVPMEDKE
jgi:hypothetical protein